MIFVSELVARPAAALPFGIAALDHEIGTSRWKTPVFEPSASETKFSTVRGALSAKSLTLNWP